jgi:EmrB/QacA subfamily drug resistance transporter
MQARSRTLAVVSAGTGLLLLDVTVVYVALPSIVADLDAGFAAVQWVVDAYAVTLAAALLTAGALADRLGRRRVFLAGLVVFTAASLACGLARSTLVLDVARAVQGLGAAAIFATSLALLAATFGPEDRGRAFGVWGAVTGAALAVGPFVGGALVDALDWRAIFLLNVPLGGLLIAATLRWVPESRDPGAAPPDWAGAALFGLGTLGLVAGLIRGGPDGWDSALVLSCLAGGALALGAFAAHEARAAAPMLPPRLFADASFSGVALVAFAQSVALYPMFLFVAVFLQRGLGLGAFEAGLWLLPSTAVLVVVAPLSGRAVGRVGLRVPLALGLGVIAAGLLLLRLVDDGSGASALLPGLVVCGIGIGIISPSLAAAMIGVLSIERAGLSSGVNNTFRQLGIAAGIAALGAIFDDAARADGFAAGLDRALLVAALVALAALPPTLALVRIR